MYANGTFSADEEVLETIEAIIVDDEDLIDLVAYALNTENEDWALVQLHERLSDHSGTFRMHSDELTDGLCKVMAKLHSG